MADEETPTTKTPGTAEPDAGATVTPSLARNIVSFVGMIIATIAALNIAFLVLADLGSKHDNPYVGVLAYAVVPAFLVLGLAIFVLGMVLERIRRRRTAPYHVPRYPDIDLNHPHTRQVFITSVVSVTVFGLISLVGTYHAYEYTDSDAFCGTMCHEIMHPEYTAYKASPHARVGCVNCHIGSGATWYVKAKFSGAYQVYATLTNRYPKPVPTPVHNLRPAQETCEQCHWPEKFWGAQLKVFNHFGYDEANTPRETRMLMKTGGGSPASGAAAAGIHWHMNIASEITYIATDEKRQVIPWVRMRDRRTGKVTEYRAQDAKLTAAQMAPANMRRMDCIDCHNRPTHIYVAPDRSVDAALLSGAINRALPYVKQQSVTALTKDYASTSQAVSTIDTEIRTYYQTKYPDLAKTHRADIDQTVRALQGIFQQTRFPEMKVDWRTHPNNIGHFYFQGCFRCHDDQHVSADGTKISKDCQACHSLLSQAVAGVPMVEAPRADFQHPVDIGDLRGVSCSDCHSGSSM